MKKYIFYALVCGMFVLSSTRLQAQTTHSDIDTQPQRYGLVLSGGGAKGLAHIGLLRMIDSLQIHIDYITGTSMGAVMSGLYATGYSGDSIKQIVLSEDWARIISNKQPYQTIHTVEKEDYDAYAIELPIRNHKPSLPSSLIEGQYLSTLLLKYTHPARHQTDFHQLTTPLELVASDIVQGGAVVMNSGSLPLSIRASLAIPTAFSPVIIDNRILVDGGLDRNFPVEEVRKMGASYIIGSYTGSRLRSADEIVDNALGPINQSYALLAKRDVDEQKGLVDVMLDFSAPLKRFSTADFAQYAQIVAVGEQEARKLLPTLMQIKAQQMAQGIVYDRTPKPYPTREIAGVSIFDEYGNPLTAYEEHLLRRIVGDDLSIYNMYANADRLMETIMGINRYDKVFYTFTPIDGGDEAQMNIFVKKKADASLGLAVHYDVKESASIILNYRRRDWLMPNSQLSAKLNISQLAKARLSYHKFLDEGVRSWIKPFVTYQLQNTNDLFLRYLSQVNNQNEATFFQASAQSGVAFGHLIGKHTAVEVAGLFNYAHLWQPTSLFANVWFDDSPKSNLNYRHTNWEANISLTQNTLNQKYFATRGHLFRATARYFVNDKSRFTSNNADESEALSQIHQLLNPAESVSPPQGNILQLSLSEQFVQPLLPKVSLRTNLFYGINIDTQKKFSENFFYDNFIYLNQKFYIGGFMNYTPHLDRMFSGLHTNEYPLNNVALATIGLQYNPVSKLYITPSVSLGSVLASLNPFDEYAKFLFGYGIDIDYMTMLGPLKLAISQSALFNKPRVFISLGYAF